MISPARGPLLSRSTWPRWLKLIAALAAALVIVVSGALLYLVAPALPDPVPGFAARKGQLVSAQELKRTVDGDFLVVETRLHSSSGLSFDIGVRTPRAATAPLPLVVLLGGLRTGHRAVYLTKNVPGITIAALSYPFPGDPRASSGLELVTWLPKMQAALIDSAPAVMLAMDYLAQQPYVDTQRVDLVGGSLGAFMVSVPASFDTRFKRVWLVHGAGDPHGVFAHLLAPYVGFEPLRDFTAQLLVLITASHHLRPEKWVARIAPRPVIAVNARDDEAMPPASVAALHQALPPGSEVIWTEGVHVRPGRNTVLEGLIHLVAERVRAEPPAPTTKP